MDDWNPVDILELNARIRACRMCEQGGYLKEAKPVVTDGGRRGGVVLIGQAPGIVEFDSGRPFGGRAGREMFRWLATVGISEDEFRDRVYMAAVTRCFPGKSPSGNGDRKPSGAEIALCRPWLEAVLQTLQPQSLVLVGGLAIERYIPGPGLTELVGRRFAIEGRDVVPLPHPSGASRWLNDPAHRDLLKQALVHVKGLWNRHREGSSSRASSGPW